MAATQDGSQIKLIVPLEKDAEDYPPYEYEELWSTPVGNGHFRIENIPLFARGIAMGDIVSAVFEGNAHRFQGVVESSGHSTIRLFVNDADAVPAVIERFEAQGCRSEIALTKLVALDVPPAVPLGELLKHLTLGQAQGQWSYEEACIFHPPEGYAEAQELWALLGLKDDTRTK
jgi:hypothetical protein